MRSLPVAAEDGRDPARRRRVAPQPSRSTSFRGRRRGSRCRHSRDRCRGRRSRRSRRSGPSGEAVVVGRADHLVCSRAEGTRARDSLRAAAAVAAATSAATAVAVADVADAVVVASAWSGLAIVGQLSVMSGSPSHRRRRARCRRSSAARRAGRPGPSRCALSASGGSQREVSAPITGKAKMRSSAEKSPSAPIRSPAFTGRFVLKVEIPLWTCSAALVPRPVWVRPLGRSTRSRMRHAAGQRDRPHPPAHDHAIRRARSSAARPGWSGRWCRCRSWGRRRPSSAAGRGRCRS